MLARAVLCSTIRAGLKPILIVAYWRFEVVKKHAGRRGKEATFGQWEWGTDADVALDNVPVDITCCQFGYCMR